MVVASEIDVLDLDFVPLRNRDNDGDGVAVGIVGMGGDTDGNVAEAFLLEVARDDGTGLVFKVGRVLSATGEGYLGFKVLTFTLFASSEGDVGDFRSLTQNDVKEDVVAFELGGNNLNVVKHALLPKFFNRRCYFVAWNGDFLPNGESGESDDDVVIIGGGTVNLNVGNGELARRGRIVNHVFGKGKGRWREKKQGE